MVIINKYVNLKGESLLEIQTPVRCRAQPDNKLDLVKGYLSK